MTQPPVTILVAWPCVVEGSTHEIEYLCKDIG